ncbi:MAG: PTS sugar transporter subunit IIA [Chloroflexi bacterium]|nr:PTS sugar transporter subunit IIA [Chloroflexota bacterium]MBU1746525.1 PTS sugar transporter subunit IIA [Chloroflexota bacterium]MBU1878964.1 PTS sugar transporter subunit IIA [Chloroflexota bacterium]
MIHIVVVSHADLSEALIRAAEMITGPIEGLHAVTLEPGESPESFGARLDAVLQPIADEETLILIDLFGGTPYNVSVRQVLKDNVECVTGANLPMLLELIMTRDEASLSELAAEITELGQASVKNLGPLLNR